MNNGGNGRVCLLRYANPCGITSSLPRIGVMAVRNLFPTWNFMMLDFLTQCLRIDPDVRPKCLALLQHQLFSQDGFNDRFSIELQRLVAKESAINPLVSKKAENPTRTCRTSTERSEYF